MCAFTVKAHILEGDASIGKLCFGEVEDSLGKRRASVGDVPSRELRAVKGGTSIGKFCAGEADISIGKLCVFEGVTRNFVWRFFAGSYGGQPDHGPQESKSKSHPTAGSGATQMHRLD